MYEELDTLLTQETTEDSWYDDGYLIARDIMNEFESEDWNQLLENVESKNLDWKKKLAYAIDNQLIEEELLVMAQLIHTDDDELLEQCIDSLRSFDAEMISTFLASNSEFKLKLQELYNASTGIKKTMLEGLFNKIK